LYSRFVEISFEEICFRKNRSIRDLKKQSYDRRQLLVLFEDREEVSGLASVIVKVEGPATPGSLRGDRARKHVGDSQL
jgi:hypothetical protein